MTQENTILMPFFTLFAILGQARVFHENLFLTLFCFQVSIPVQNLREN